MPLDWRLKIPRVQTMANLAQAGVSPVTAEVAPVSSFSAGLSPAFEALASPPTRRSALLLLAGESLSALTLDFALTADYEQLNTFCETLLRKTAAAARPTDGLKLAFLLESSCLEHLTTLLSKDKLPGELQALLLKHAGQAGRQASSLEDALRSSRTVDSLKSRISDENWIALEDNSPAARVRAHDWLQARGEAPRDFDPLGASKDRRKALEKALESRAIPATAIAPVRP